MSSTRYIDPSATRNRWLWLSLAGAGVLLASIGYIGYTTLFPSEAASLAIQAVTQTPEPGEPALMQTTAPIITQSEQRSPSQLLQTETDSVTGFSVGRPETWQVSATDGLIVISQGTCPANAVIIFPTELQTRSPSLSELLSSELKPIITQLLEQPAPLSLGSIDSSHPSRTQALLTGTVCGQSVTGHASLTVEGTRALLKAAWYARSEEAVLQNTVTQIEQSYKRMTSTAIARVVGQELSVPVPNGWIIDEAEQTTSVHSGDLEVRLTALDFPATESLDTALDSWLQLQTDSGQELVDLTQEEVIDQSGDDRAGRRWNSRSRLVTFTRGGVAFIGILTADYTDALGNRALIRWRSAPRSQWTTTDSLLQLLERGAQLQVPDPGDTAKSVVLQSPAYATWSNESPLAGTQLRTTLLSAGTGVWQPELHTLIALRSSDNQLFVAYTNARNTQTGDYRTTVDGRSVILHESVNE